MDNMKAKIIKPKSNSLEDLQEYISECSSVVRDKTPKSASKLWDRLLKESEGNKPSRLFEFIPCKILAEYDIFLQYKNQYFGHLEDDGQIAYYTNMRELLSLGLTVNECLEYVNFDNYYTFKCQAPYFIYGQLSTHNQITSVSHSQRNSYCDRGYWMPNEVSKKINNNQIVWDNLVSEEFSPKKLKEFMKKDCGINRKEVFDRGSDMLQNRVFVLGGYTNNNNAFPHFFRQRLDLHTQKETRDFVSKMVKEINSIKDKKSNK